MIPYQVLKPYEKLKVEFISDWEKENFEKIKSKQPEEWIWNHKKIVYNRNSHGFRCEEFDTIDWENSNVVIGCSRVFGHSIDEQNTISHNLEKTTGENYINLGLCGAGPDTCYHHAIWAKTLGVKKIIILMPNISRFSMFLKDYAGNHITRLIKSTDDKLDIADIDEYFNVPRYIADGYDLESKYKMYCSLLSGLDNTFVFDFVNKDSDIFTGDWTSFVDKKELIEKTKNGIEFFNFYKGRDMLHPGIQENKEYVKFILEQLDTVNQK